MRVKMRFKHKTREKGSVKCYGEFNPRTNTIDIKKKKYDKKK